MQIYCIVKSLKIHILGDSTLTMVMKYSVGFVKNLIIHILGESTSTMVMKYSIEARHKTDRQAYQLWLDTSLREVLQIFFLFCFGVQCVADVLYI